MAGTNVSYNGIVLTDCETLRFDQTITYDDSGTDALYSKFNIRVACTVHPDATGTNHGVKIPGFASYMTGTTWMRAVQTLLSQPRAIFIYSVNDEVLLRCDPDLESPYSDCNNGPKPQDLSITNVWGSKGYRIEFEIELTRMLCTDPSGYIDPRNTTGAAADARVLNNRWTVSEERDAAFLMTRVVEGKLVTSHILNWPHAFRYLVLPPLQASFKRESMRFWDSADGLTMQYQIIDKQKYAAPPAPAINWYATYTESCSNAGELQFGEVRVILEGAVETHKHLLFTAAMGVVFARLKGILRYQNNEQDQAAAFLQQFSVVEHLHENRLEVTALVRHNSVDKKYIGLRLGKIGEDLSWDIPGYDNSKWPWPSPYIANAPIGIFAKYWQDPCVDIHGIPNAIPVTPSNDTKKNEREAQKPYDEIVYPPGTQLPPNLEDRTSATQRGIYPYTLYEIDSEYDEDLGVVCLPTSAVTTVSSDSITSKVLQVHSGTCRRVIHIHAERIGAWPRFPNALKTFVDANGIRYFLLRRRLYPTQPTLTADGDTKLFTCQLRLMYAMSRPPILTDKLSVLADPRSQYSLDDKLINLATLYTLEGLE
jgi:hypothetical protein